MSCIVHLGFLPLKARADEVPEAIAYERIEVIHADKSEEFILHMRFSVAECHTRSYIFLIISQAWSFIAIQTYLDIMQFDLFW